MGRSNLSSGFVGTKRVHSTALGVRPKPFIQPEGAGPRALPLLESTHLGAFVHDPTRNFAEERVTGRGPPATA
jgi:hypothetical protein